MFKTIAFLDICCLLAFLPVRTQVHSGAQKADVKETAFCVATNGSDQNPGTMAKPFATLEKAKAAQPGEAVIHIYQADYWGNLQWKIRAVDETQKAIWFGDGGRQIGAKWYDNPAEVDESSRFFIENVFEELDAPGEWYLDRKEGVLYYKPASGADLKKALVEVPVLEQIDSNCFTSDFGNFVARVHFRREQDAQNTDGKKAEKYSLEE